MPIRSDVAKRGWARVADVNGRRVWCSLYVIWRSMRERCLCATYRDYKYYGGRGITICAEWSSYDVFRAWAVSRGFCKGMTIERNDTNGNYGPSNCRWIPKRLQQDNTRRVHRLTVGGITRSLPEWSRITGMAPEVLRGRLKGGWSHEQIVTLPLGAIRPGMLRGRAAAKAKRLAAMGQEGR
jgi:hypothetical protein